MSMSFDSIISWMSVYSYPSLSKIWFSSIVTFVLIFLYSCESEILSTTNLIPKLRCNFFCFLSSDSDYFSLIMNSISSCLTKLTWIGPNSIFFLVSCVLLYTNLQDSVSTVDIEKNWNNSSSWGDGFFSWSL